MFEVEASNLKMDLSMKKRMLHTWALHIWAGLGS